MTRSYWQRQGRGTTLHCDVAVVGAGIVGCSTAYWLKKKGIKRVALIDAHQVGHGASGRNAGFLLQGAAVDYVTDVAKYGEKKAQALWTFTTENRQLIASELPVDKIALEASGSLIIAGSSEEDERLVASAELLQQFGQSVSYWPASTLQDRINGVGFKGALHVDRGARVDSIKLVREIAGRSGALILEGHSVLSVHEEAGGIALETTQRKVFAEQVILCVNAYLPRLLLETSPLVKPVRAQMFLSHPHGLWLDYPIYSHEGYYYLRQLKSGELLVGGARHLHLEDEVGYEDESTKALRDSLNQYLHSHFPHLGETKAQYGWSGVMGFTEDGLPIVAQHEPIPGCYWAAGFNGHGMGYGFRFGKMMAEILCHTTNEIENRKLFDIARFE